MIRKNGRKRILENVEMAQAILFAIVYFRDMLSEIATSFWKDNWCEQGEKMKKEKNTEEKRRTKWVKKFHFFARMLLRAFLIKNAISFSYTVVFCFASMENKWRQTGNKIYIKYVEWMIKQECFREGRLRVYPALFEMFYTNRVSFTIQLLQSTIIQFSWVPLILIRKI